MPVNQYRLCACLLCFSAALEAQTPTGYKDENEYNLVRAIQVQPLAQRQLELLARWRQLYPRSAFRQERFQLTLEAYQRLGQGARMLETAYAMAADDPQGLGNYWVATLVVNQRELAPRALHAAETSARALLADSGSIYAENRKPAAVDAESWVEQRVQSETLAHRALGWVAMCRSQWNLAETEFRIVLLRDANDAEASYWTGVAILSLGHGREPAAFYHLARSLALNGPGELTAEEKRQARDYFEAAYVRRHGSLRGLDRLYAEALRGGPIPTGQ